MPLSSVPRSHDDSRRHSPTALGVGSFGGTDVLPSVSEDGGLIFQRALQEAPVRHHPDIPPRSKITGGQCAKDEVQVHAAGQLIETERHLELARLQLQPPREPRVGVDITLWL